MTVTRPRRRSLLAALVLAAFTLAACSTSGAEVASQAPGALAPAPAEYAGKSNPYGPEAAAAGAALYNTNCEMCHGTGGHGDGPVGTSLVPPPKNLPELSAVASDDYIFWRVSTGKPGTGMMPWKGALTDDQIWQIIAYVRTLK